MRYENRQIPVPVNVFIDFRVVDDGSDAAALLNPVQYSERAIPIRLNGIPGWLAVYPTQELAEAASDEAGCGGKAMKASELIARLQELVDKHGDCKCIAYDMTEEPYDVTDVWVEDGYGANTETLSTKCFFIYA